MFIKEKKIATTTPFCNFWSKYMYIDGQFRVLLHRDTIATVTNKGGFLFTNAS